MKRLFMLWLILIGITMVARRITDYRIFQAVCTEQPAPDS